MVKDNQVQLLVLVVTFLMAVFVGLQVLEIMEVAAAQCSPDCIFLG